MNTVAILRQTMDILKMEPEIAVLKEEDRKAYFEAFQPFDWNSNGKISYGSLLYAMRRAGANPTEVEVHDIINRMKVEHFHLMIFARLCLRRIKRLILRMITKNHSECLAKMKRAAYPRRN